MCIVYYCFILWCNTVRITFNVKWGKERQRIFRALLSAFSVHSVFPALHRWRLPFFCLACKKVFLYLWRYSYCHCLTPQFNNTNPPDCIAPLWLLKWHPVLSFFLFLTQSFFTSCSFFLFFSLLQLKKKVLTKESRWCRYVFCLDPAFHFLVTASHSGVCMTSMSFIIFTRYQFIIPPVYFVASSNGRWNN